MSENSFVPSVDIKIPRFSKSLELCNSIFLTIGFSVRSTRRHWTIAFLLKAFYVLCSLVISTCIAGELTYLLEGIRNYTNFLKLTEVAPCCGFCILGVCKLLTVQLQIQKVNNIIDQLDNMYHQIAESQKPTVARYMSILIWKHKLFVILMMFLIWIFNLCALCLTLYIYFVEHKVVRLLPYLVWTPFDPIRPDIYPFMYLYHVAAGHVAMSSLLGADLLFSFLTGHLCMHFELLRQRISRIGLSQSRNSHKNQLRADLHHELVKCILQHNILIEIGRELETIFSFSIFVNFCGSSVLICLVGFQTTAVTGINLFMFAIFLISMVTQIYQLCQSGHQLIHKSVSLSDAIYECDWYNADLKFRRSATILLVRTQKPQKLTAMRFSVVSLTSFGKIMSTSWSYFTLLQTVYQGSSK